MANILTASEAATVLRCDITDADMLALLPLVDDYLFQATSHDWAKDDPINITAKSAARMLLVLWHENPSMITSGMTTLSFGLNAVLMQLKSLALRYHEFFGCEGAGSISLPGVMVGDTVQSLTGLVGVTGDQSAQFEEMITVEDHIQQVVDEDLSANAYRVYIVPLSAL
ncbi:MAG TPA: hypothetical protein DIW44_12515 [Anaerolineaceae bacterium]|nr:hypothetical protein [Anaerolineaceae bacterium]